MTSNRNGQPDGHARRAGSKSAIPQVLKDQARWIEWSIGITKQGKPTKVPHGSVLKPEHRGPFKGVENVELGPDGGVGFVFTGGVDTPRGRVVGFDLDACRDPENGALSPWVEEVLLQYSRPFTEITPSGTGLRAWLLVKNPPKALPKIRIPADAPPGVTHHHPEIQVFGLGSAQYVTVTGDQLPGSGAEPAEVEDLSWLQTRYRVAEIDASEAKLPRGEGVPPTTEQILERVLKAPQGAQLVAGDWPAFGVPSASELWWRLCRAAIRAAGGHGQAALGFLLHATAFGEGLVDSRDPAKYMRSDWVAADLARIAGKADEVSGFERFDDEFDAEAWEPPQTGHKGSWLLTAAEFARKVIEQRFLVYGVLPAAGLAQFFGDPGCGKTPYALSLALHVATGAAEWFGHEIENPGPVVYMVGEDASGIRDRMMAQLEAMGHDMGLEDVGLLVSTHPGRLIEPANRKRWAEEIKAAAGGTCSLVVVDTQARNFGPGNENSTEDMSAFVDQLDALSRELGCLVLLVHHTGHQSKERGRGSSTLPAAIDAQYEIRRAGLGVTARSTKAKNWAEPEPLVGTLTPVIIGEDSKGRDITAITLRDTPPKPGEVFATPSDDLRALLVEVQRLAGESVSQTALAAGAGVSRGSLRRLVEQAKTLELLSVAGGGRGNTKTAYTLTPQGLASLSTIGQNPVANSDDGDADDIFS